MDHEDIQCSSGFQNLPASPDCTPEGMVSRSQWDALVHDARGQRTGMKHVHTPEGVREGNRIRVAWSVMRVCFQS